ncbi:hypothetical protein NM688_g4475 [Phlebia brevispora]|uniref:Uncharacterized protein n=1 Tax=Phlebia brevispora TaxID=194682 RepID=A0ACC1T2Y9_9APHY|nr:hypothetical protein NM688_g4475 [Phlebia brevispora]
MKEPYMKPKIAATDTGLRGQGPTFMECETVAIEQEVARVEVKRSPVGIQPSLSETELIAAEAQSITTEVQAVIDGIDLAVVEVYTASNDMLESDSVGEKATSTDSLESAGLDAEAVIFELEIPRKWRFGRRSYPGRGPVWWDDDDEPWEDEYEDPMDEDDFDEATAFPLLKPNIEVFGLAPPATLRRQRGWHQRKRSPPAKGNGGDRGRKAMMGANFSEKLSDLVVGTLCWEHHPDRHEDKVKASKRELASIALVCHRWAELVQPIIFEWIAVPNFEDVAALRHFLRSPTSAVSKYLRTVQLYLNLTSHLHAPWIHAACLTEVFDKYSIILKAEGPLPSGHIMTGFYDMLPRSAPWFCSRTETLWLTKVHFKSLSHLMQAVGNMPDLKLVKLEQVTWNCPLDNETHALPTRRARYRAPPEYLMKGCTDNAAIVWFRFLIHCPGSKQLEQADSDRLYCIASLLTKSGSGRMTRLVGGDDDGDIDTRFQLFGEGAHWSFELSVTLTQHGEERGERIRSIHFAADSFRAKAPADCAWTGIGDLVESLPSLEALSFISWANDSKSDLVFVHNEIVRRTMSSLHNLSKIGYYSRAFLPSVGLHVNRIELLDLGILELEIPREWRFSRVCYPRRGPVWWTPTSVLEEGYEDPMDDEKFDEATAFPRLKPNIEVFGLSPPATLRRQRGWYQRKRWSPSKEKGVNREETPAIGADVPPELFDIVLGWLANEGLRNASKGRVGATNRELGSMALVCRRWAKLVQPIIFEWIELRNREDVATVRKSLRSPATAVSKHLRHPQLNLDGTTYHSNTPWIHTACASNDFERHSIVLKIEGPLQSGRSMKGFHDLLPRSGPWFCSRITDLWLTNVHFKSLLHLMRAIGDMPDLTGARLEKVTWDRPLHYELHSPLARRARFRVHPRYTMEGCTDDAAIVWFRLLLQCPGSNRLVHADAGRLYCILSALSKSGEHKSLECPEVGYQGIGVGVFFMFCDQDGYRCICVHVTFTPDADGHAVNIRTIAIEAGDFQRRLSADPLCKEIDDAAGSLPALELLYFLCGTGGIASKADILFVHAEIVAKKMPILRSLSKVRYAMQLKDGPESKWVWTRTDISSGDDGPNCKHIGPRVVGEFGWQKFL